MPNTYTQIHIHFVFAVKYREGLIHHSWKDELNKYITGIVRENEHKMIAINSMADHIHILIGMQPSQSVSSLMQDVKGSSSKWINSRKFVNGVFQWQEGYGAFSYSKSQLSNVIQYIENQEEHHSVKSFKEEYIEFLKQFEIEYEENYIFKELE